MNRVSVTLQGRVIGLIWQGLMCQLPIALALPKRGVGVQPPRASLFELVEAFLAGQGDFQACRLAHDCRIVVETVELTGDRERIHRRSWPIWRFKSLHGLVSAPRRSVYRREVA